MKHLKKHVRLLTALFIGLGLASCTSIPIRDGEACADLGSFGGHCNYLFKEQPRDLDPEAWDKERIGMICTKSDNFVGWQADIQKLCAVSKRCTKDDTMVIDSFFDRMKEFQAIIEQQKKQNNSENE